MIRYDETAGAPLAVSSFPLRISRNLGGDFA